MTGVGNQQERGPAATLLAALLPSNWRDRSAMLEAADRLDRARPDGLDALLAGWIHWRSTGELPLSHQLRDLVASLATVLGGVGPELRLRPRERGRV